MAKATVKIADALNISLGYLLGKSDKLILDKKNIFYTIDNLIKATKLKNIFAL